MELAGREPQPGADRWTIFWRIYATDGTPVPLDQSAMAMALREQRAVEQQEIIIERPDGMRRQCLPYSTPLFDPNGRLSGAVNLLMDVTERHKAQIESAHLAAIVSSSSDAIVSNTLNGVIRSWNRGASEIFGYQPEEIIGQPITRIIPPDLHEEEEEILARLRRGERIENFETKRVTKDDRIVDISLTVSPVHDRWGRIMGASKVARDITERKRAEELQRLLIGELNHRVKNTLATVQSIVNQTVRLARSPSEFTASLSGRIQALSQAHDLLARNSWTGTDLLLLARGQILLGGVEDGRVYLSGPSVSLDPQPALHLALILHELGTNARKYGSLSVPDGQLKVDWAVRTSSGRQLLLHWKEAGGPPVEVPRTGGFGTALIERSLAAHGGEATTHYEADGARDCSTPPRRSAVGGNPGSTRLFRSPTARPITAERGVERQRHHVLVVEDEMPIAMDVATVLTEADCAVVGPASTTDEALKLIEEGAFDVALLDANLNGRPVDALAAALTRRNKPFAFLTSYGPEGLPQAFQNALLINKPFTAEEAVGTVARLAESRASVVPLRRQRE